ncbi:MAG: tetratricopeptide repeat protein, partial [Proteobacteria bacterium]|nr:tetratricopeptide repeat protein [Pseudomonadota bacterium]
MTSPRRPDPPRGRRQSPPSPLDPAAISRELDAAAAHFRAGRLDAAAQVYRRLARDAPDDLRPAYSLAVIDLNQGRLARARERLQALAAQHPEFAPAWHNLAAARQALGDWAGAAQGFARAVDLQPGAGESRTGLAGALAAMGQFAAAIAQNRLLAAQPLHRWAALTRIALIDAGAIGDDDLGAMQAAAEDPAVESGLRVGLWFALGEVLDHRGRDAEAFEAYDAGNRLKRARLDVAGAAADGEATVRRVLTTATAEFLVARAGQGTPTGAPIFIVGFPRSGSTLAERILVAHPGVQGLGETGVLPRLLEAG